MGGQERSEATTTAFIITRVTTAPWHCSDTLKKEERARRHFLSLSLSHTHKTKQTKQNKTKPERERKDGNDGDPYGDEHQHAGYAAGNDRDGLAGEGGHRHKQQHLR